MSITDSMPRNQKKLKTKKQDFYQTPKKAVEILTHHFDFTGVKKDLKVLDPCCGHRIISNQLQNYFNDVNFFDLYPTDLIIPEMDFLKFNDLNFDIIVMNPPYSQKKEFIYHALNISEDVYAYLPLQIMNYIDFTEEILNTELFKGQIICYPKMILDETQNPKQGGMTAYAWFHFSNTPNERLKYQYYYDLRSF